MKVLSFGCTKDDRIYVEQVLPALLKTFGYNNDVQQMRKTTTIRPAWKRLQLDEKHEVVWNGTKTKHYITPKDPYLKVGDMVQAMWKCRGTPKGSWFHRRCGSLASRASNKDFLYCEQCQTHLYPLRDIIDGITREFFPKILGTARITGVSRTQMWRNRGGFGTDGADLSVMSLDDGFHGPASMMTYFDREYPISSPKPFYVYEFEAVNGRSEVYS